LPISAAQRAERARGNTHETSATAGRIDRRQVAAFVLDDGTGFAGRPCLARSACLADVQVNAEDRAHGLIQTNLLLPHGDAFYHSPNLRATRAQPRRQSMQSVGTLNRRSAYYTDGRCPTGLRPRGRSNRGNTSGQHRIAVRSLDLRAVFV